ncbi:CDP-glycerol glycerophosphotransferase family protein [bacterium 210820-DFI.6.37]|nr:CDP-glycerol glycerophosphotransferase family protein [bacterium 210820-DFI.6.37]
MNRILKTGIKIFQCLYCIIKCFPTQKKVTFISRQSNSASLDISMLEKVILEQHPDFKTVILCKKIEGSILCKIGYCFHMLRQMYHLATSQIVILDSYAILVSILNHKPNLLIIQMWHSIGTMKKFGYSILDMEEGSSSQIARIMKMHANYDYILAASDAYKTHLAEGFHYPLSKIVTLPLPRVEALESSQYAVGAREKIFLSYPQLREKPTILYVPTFRKGENQEFAQAAIALADAVDYSRYNLIIKAHPLAEFKETHPFAVIDHRFSSFDMLFVCDYVISDYSCIIYEAAVLKRPLYFYAYDYDRYMSTRDIYMDYKKEMPGPICSTAAEIVQAISDQACDPENVQKFLRKYVTPKSNHETKDIVDFIFSRKKV